MKKIISVLTAVCMALTIQYGFAYSSQASENDISPSVYIELGTLKSKDERGFFSAGTTRQDREKTSARAGERLSVTFILTGIDELEYFQLAGSYNQNMLRTGYYDSRNNWQYGDSVQDSMTIIDDCSDFGIQGLDCSFSFTREDYEPSIYLCAYTTDKAVNIPDCITLEGSTVSGAPIMSVGFEALRDIDNIYDAFTWDSKSTMISSGTGNKEHTLDNGLTVVCPHQYQLTVTEPDCETEGYSCYSCMYCNYEYICDYKEPAGHFFTVTSSTKRLFNYACTYCGVTNTKNAAALQSMWDEKYINCTPQRTSTGDSSYLDVVTDGTINAKDFRVIRKLY